MLRRSLEGRTNVAVFAMIPEVTRILKLRAFWDIYYEHCTYYSPGSLARAFRSAGFDTTSLSTEFGDQYVAISAVPGEGAGASLAEEETPAQLARMVDDFAAHIDLLHHRWREWVRSQRDSNRRVVLWGGGSKAVAFLTTLGLSPEDMELVVDINPRRTDTYVSGTGQRIVEPEFLRHCRPDSVVIMNPNYRGEIAAQLEGMGLAPQLLSVEDHLAG
jgi:hypothetical protein